MSELRKSEKKTAFLVKKIKGYYVDLRCKLFFNAIKEYVKSDKTCSMNFCSLTFYIAIAIFTQ